MLIKGIVLIIVYLLLRWAFRFLFAALLIRFVQNQMIKAVSKGVEQIGKRGAKNKNRGDGGGINNNQRGP